MGTLGKAVAYNLAVSTQGSSGKTMQIVKKEVDPHHLAATKTSNINDTVAEIDLESVNNTEGSNIESRLKAKSEEEYNKTKPSQEKFVKKFYPSPHNVRADKWPNKIGESFENWTGILLSMQKPRYLTNNIEIKTDYNDDFKEMEVDYIMLEKSNQARLFEVKAKENPCLGNHFTQYISMKIPVTYVMQNEKTKEVFKERALSKIKKKEILDRRNFLKVTTPKEMNTYPLVEGSRMATIMEDRDEYLKYKKNHDLDILPVNLYSIYNSILRNKKVNLHGIHIALEAAYQDSEELKDTARHYGFEWMNKSQYNGNVNPGRYRNHKDKHPKPMRRLLK